MAKHYVTFGQTHVHSVNGKTFDKNCVAVFEAEDYTHGRQKAFKYFGSVFCFDYHSEQWNEDNLKWFPRGYIELP